MKTLNLKYLIALIFIFTSSEMNSQSVSRLTYNINSISIDYKSSSILFKNARTGNVETLSGSQRLDNISTLKFLNDSMISVSGDNNSNEKLNIDKINSITIKNGSYFGKGIGLGALAGLGIGAALGAIIGSVNWFSGEFITYQTDPGAGAAIGSATGLLIGGLIGSIIGANNPSYETYNMNKFNLDKKKELERILNVISSSIHRQH